jgi:RNA polymerase sigma factor (TIGR02999 family)
VDGKKAAHWHSRGHFFAAAADAMRKILVERARSKSRQKRGGNRQRIDLDRIQVADCTPSEDLLALDEAVQALATEDPVCAKLVELRFFAGLTIEQAAMTMGLPKRTADRRWAYARAWLYQALCGDGNSGYQKSVRN